AMHMVEDRHAAKFGEILVEKGPDRGKAAGMLQPIDRRATRAEADQLATGKKGVVAATFPAIGKAKSKHALQVPFDHCRRGVEPEGIEEGDGLAILEQVPFGNNVRTWLKRRLKRQFWFFQTRVKTDVIQVANYQGVTPFLAGHDVCLGDRGGEASSFGV